MKQIILAFSFLFVSLAVQADFDRYFYNKTLRFDYVHCGNNVQDFFYFDELLEEPYWAGSKKNLIDTLNYGNSYVKLYDLQTNKLIYSRGYNTLFGEWQTTPEATKISRACNETVVVPFPRNNARIELWTRDKKGKMQVRYKQVINSRNYFIKRDRRLVFPTKDIHVVAENENAVDIVLLAEGYTADELDRFIIDCHKFAAGLLSFSPYKENKAKFNIRAVLSPSKQTGSDVPRDDVWRNTVFNSSFYTFDTERYIMTYDNKSIRDAAANVPYDFIYILANTSKYGGGAIYNHYGLSVSGNPQYAKIYVHEFGHLFLGLGDEYVGNSAYSDMYPLDVEPWEANLTTLVNFNSKWKDLVDKNTPIPTKVNSSEPDKVGVYEGGGYVSKGVYRPSPTCLMNTLSTDHFCPVCKRAIIKQIHFYTD